MNILETKDLCFSYQDGTDALKNVNIEIKKGSTTAFLGGNGAGKSTLFLNLNGILTPNKGELYYNEKKVGFDNKSKKELRKKVGIVFQDPDDQLFSASVYQDIAFGPLNMGLSNDQVKERVMLAMEHTKISHLKDKPTHNLSFGQKKRVALAGVLAMQPEILILDEPTAGLDPMGVSELMQLLLEIQKKFDTAIVLSTHDIDIIPLYCDFVYVIDNGEIVKKGSPNEIFSDKKFLREKNLRLPRIAHLMEILEKNDNYKFDGIATTISEARKMLNNFFEKIRK